MKKLLLLFLLVSLLLSSCVKESPEPLFEPDSFFSETGTFLRTVQIEGITYELYSNSTCHISQAEPAEYGSSSLFLPDEVDQYKVVAIEDEVFQNGSFSHVRLPAFLERIGNKCFEHTQLVEVKLPSTVKELGEEAFANCTRLETVTLSDSMTALPTGAFFGCNLKEVKLPKGVTSIGEEAFGDNRELGSITLPDSLTSIGPYAFWRCALSSDAFRVPEQVSEIGCNAFSQTPWLESKTEEWVVVGQGVLIRYNGTAASVTLPEQVRYLSNAFDSSPTTALTVSDTLLGIATDALAESQVKDLSYQGNGSGPFAILGQK